MCANTYMHMLAQVHSYPYIIIFKKLWQTISVRWFFENQKKPSFAGLFRKYFLLIPVSI